MNNQTKSPYFFASNSPNDVNAYFSNTPHILNSLTISLCIAGYAKMKLNITEQKLQANQLIFILPNTIIEPLEVSNNFRLHSIVFDYNFIASLPLLHSLYMDNTIRQYPILDLDVENYAFIEQLFSMINQYYYRNDVSNNNEVISHLLSALISELSRLFLSQTVTQKTSRTENITNSFLTLLHNNYTKERNVTFYADKLNISPKYLTTVVRQSTGKPISDWINEFVIIYAKSLLKSTDDSITQISEDVGLSESTLFARYFKRYTGMTPTEFRRK